MPPLPLADLLAERDGAFGAAADPTLLARLDLKLGDRVTVGNATFQIRSVLEAEPDKLAGGIGFGPRFLISEAALRATGLIQPGSLVRWTYRVQLPDNAASDARRSTPDRGRRAAPRRRPAGKSARAAMPRRSSSATSSRFTQFLTLVGLTALLVGGVGVANAVKRHLDRRRDVIATLKALGATGGDVFAIYLTQVMLLAAIGSVIGLGARRGAAVRHRRPVRQAPAAAGRSRRCIPASSRCRFVYGLLTALAFALWPLGRAHDVPVAALFRDAVAPMAPAALALSRADGAS